MSVSQIPSGTESVVLHAGKVKLTGVLTRLIGCGPAHGKRRTRVFRLGPVRGSARAGRALTLTVNVPAAAMSALRTGASESATFTVTVGGTGRASTKIAMLR